MANIKSAKKRAKQEPVRRQHNQSRRAMMRTAIKKVRAFIAGGDVKAAKEALPVAVSVVSKVAKTGAIAQPTANRIKSRLAQAVKKADMAA